MTNPSSAPQVAIERAVLDQPGSGILLDIWHLARGGIAYEEVTRLPGKYISAIELNDAKKEIIGELWQDTIYRRLLPGDGDLNPPEFIKAVEKSGYTGYWGVEILSEKLRKLPVRDMAMQALTQQYCSSRNRFKQAPAQANKDSPRFSPRAVVENEIINDDESVGALTSSEPLPLTLLNRQSLTKRSTADACIR